MSTPRLAALHAVPALGANHKKFAAVAAAIAVRLELALPSTAHSPVKSAHGVRCEV